MSLMRIFIAETMVLPHLLTFLCMFSFLLKDLNFFLMIMKYVNLQNIFCCYFHSENEYIEIC